MKQTQEALNRTGCKHLYTLQEGESWCVFGSKIVIAHPNNKPKIIHEDGTIEVVELQPA